MMKKRKAAGNFAASKQGNQRRIIRRIITESIFILLVCGALGIGAYLLADLAAGEKKRGDESETELLQLTGKTETLRRQLAELQDALPLAQKVFDSEGNSTMELSREAASSVFSRLRAKYAFGDLTINVSPIEPQEDSKLNKKQVQAIRSIINVQIKAFTDEQVVAYIDDVMDELPGLVALRSLEISRGNEFTLDEAPAADGAVSLNTPQVSAKAEFVWYGFKLKPKDEQGG